MDLVLFVMGDYFALLSNSGSGRCERVLCCICCINAAVLLQRPDSWQRLVKQQNAYSSRYCTISSLSGVGPFEALLFLAFTSRNYRTYAYVLQLGVTELA